MNLTLKVWRQKNTNTRGKFVTYQAKNISPDMSFLEMLDVVNEELTRNNASEHLALFTRNGADVEALRQPLANFAIEQLQVLSLPYRSSHEEAAP